MVAAPVRQRKLQARNSPALGVRRPLPLVEAESGRTVTGGGGGSPRRRCRRGPRPSLAAGSARDRAGDGRLVRGGAAVSAPRERSVSHSISGTALEWEQLRHLAESEGKAISRFIGDSMAERRRSRTGEARLDEMARTGRHDSMRELLTSIVGPERAARILRRVLNRNSPRS